MKPSLALVALFIAACGSTTEPPTAPVTGTPTAADSCARPPGFRRGGDAAERDLFAYDANVPLNLQEAVESTNNGVEVSAISFGSPAGGSVTGLLFDPVTRSSLRPGIVLMHGMPGTARAMAPLGQLLAQHGAVVIAIDAPFARRAGRRSSSPPRIGPSRSS